MYPATGGRWRTQSTAGRPRRQHLPASAHLRYAVSTDDSFRLVGCRGGTAVIWLLDPANSDAVLQEYVVTVSP